MSALHADLSVRPARLAEAQRLTTLNPLPVGRDCPVLTAPRDAGHDDRPQAAGRDPCPKCETRGDFGCAHFAPCEPVSIAWFAETQRHGPKSAKPKVPKMLPLADRIAVATAYASGEDLGAIASRYTISTFQVDRIARARGIPKRAAAR